jgi:hypothetical protein
VAFGDQDMSNRQQRIEVAGRRLGFSFEAPIWLLRVPTGELSVVEQCRRGSMLDDLGYVTISRWIGTGYKCKPKSRPGSGQSTCVVPPRRAKYSCASHNPQE